MWVVGPDGSLGGEDGVFTAAMWAEIRPIYEAILALPFNRELAAGTLTRERFTFYMVQDAHYLGAFARALATAAAKATTPDAQIKLAKSAHDAIVVERALHEGFFREFGVSAELRRHPALAHLRRLQRFPAGNVVSASVRGRDRGTPALLPDLLRGRQAPLRDRRRAEPLPALDRHLPRRGVRGVGARGLGAHGRRIRRQRQASGRRCARPI